MSKGEKRIGFVDYNLENFHSNVYLKLLRNELEHRGFVVAGCMGMRPRACKTWAEANGVPYFPDAAGLNEAVDYFMVLAPSTPETHLELCRKVFPFGKPTYVDKTFAPDLHTARRIFTLADRHRVPMQTTSALRYTEVRNYVEEIGRRQVRHMVTTTTATRHFQVDSGRLFLNTADAVLNLFESGKPAIDRKESLIIRRIPDAAGLKRALSGFVSL